MSVFVCYIDVSQKRQSPRVRPAVSQQQHDGGDPGQQGSVPRGGGGRTAWQDDMGRLAAPHQSQVSTAKVSPTVVSQHQHDGGDTEQRGYSYGQCLDENQCPSHHSETKEVTRCARQWSVFASTDT